MVNFEEYFSYDRIIDFLCKERVRTAVKRHKKEFYRNISSKAENPHSVSSPVDALLPPRKQWIRPRKGERLNKSASEVNMHSIKKTISRRIKRGVAQNEGWFRNLTAFINRVRELALAGDNYSISKPHIFPIEKDKSKKTYRLIADYNVLEDKVIIALTAKYLRHIFDEDSLACSYTFCGGDNNGQNSSTRDSAVRNLIDYSKSYDSLYVAEADIQKFFDTIHQDVARNALNRAIKRANERGIEVDSRAVSIFDSYLASYTFAEAKEVANDWFKEKGIEGNIECPEEALRRFYNDVADEPIGIPQGGALSPIIANLVLDNADRAVIQDIDNPDPDLFYARYCDDMIIIHPDARACAEAFTRYLRALEGEGLLVHPPVLVEEYGKDYYDLKSKLPFAWCEPKGRKAVVPWISFLGYQVRYDQIIRVRKNSIEKEMRKQVQIVDRTIHLLDRGETVSDKSAEEILCRVAGKLIAMSVGRVQLGKEQYARQCWSSGQQLLREYDHIKSQLKELDRNREKQLSRLKRRLDDYDLKDDIEPKTQKRKQKLPKHFGAPFSYFSAGIGECLTDGE